MVIRKEWLKSEDLLEINEIMRSKIFSDTSVTHVQSVSLESSEDSGYLLGSDLRLWPSHSIKRERTKEAYRELGLLDKECDHLIIGS